MEQSREERMQQRLRGAQRRHIKEVDFGLSIPAASAPEPSPPLPAQDQEAATSPQTPNLPTFPPAQTTTITTTESAKPTTSYSVNDANTSAKRRKLDSDAPALSSGGRSTRSSRSAPRPDIYALFEDEPSERPALGLEEQYILNEPAPQTTEPERIPETQSSINEDGPEPQATPSVHFAEETTIISIDRRVGDEEVRERLKDDTVSRLGDIINDSPLQSSEIETPIRARKRKRPLTAAAKSPPFVEDDFDELSPEQPTKQPRRPKAIIADDAEDRDPLSDPVEEQQAEEIDDELAATVLSRNKIKRKTLEPAPLSKQVKVIEASDLPEPKRQRRRHREESNRSEQRQPKRKASNKAQTSKKRGGKPKVRAGSPIAVTVHRLTKAPVYDEEDSDADILNAEIPNSKRSGVNAVDVLRQVCEELFGSALESLEDGRNRVNDPILRKEYLTKWRALNSFAEEVYARLIEHTINLDNSFALERRVKAENRKKLHLREEILRLRAEREKIALRMDEVRIRHENESTSANELTALNTSLHDIELAVERGKLHSSDAVDKEPTDLVGIEMQLKRVAGLASNRGGEGGLLRQIQDFNAFLERTALALETRRA